MHEVKYLRFDHANYPLFTVGQEKQMAILTLLYSIAGNTSLVVSISWSSNFSSRHLHSHHRRANNRSRVSTNERDHQYTGHVYVEYIEIEAQVGRNIGKQLSTTSGSVAAASSGPSRPGN